MRDTHEPLSEQTTMTDEQLNLYIDLRRKYARTCADIENFKTERSGLDEVYTKGTLPPEKVGFLERLLVALRLRRRRLTRLDGKRLREIEDRLNYNRILLKVGQVTDSSVNEKQSMAVFSPIDPNKQAIVEKLHSFSEQDLKEALIMLKRKELARLEAEL